MRVGLSDALGLVLAEAVAASHDIPPFANSAMDGFAVRASDVSSAPVVLPVVDEVAAGALATREVAAGTSIKIMTGAPMPEGADAVVKVEDTEAAAEDKVRIMAAVEPGTAVRPAGGDIAARTVVLSSGERLGPAHLGVLASLGEAVPPRAAPPGRRDHVDGRRNHAGRDQTAGGPGRFAIRTGFSSRVCSKRSVP